MSRKIDRRTFFEKSAVSSAGILLGGMVAGCSGSMKKIVSDYDVMADVMKYRKIDAHEHVYLYEAGPEVQIDFADRLHIEKLVVSRPVTTQTGTPDEFIDANNHVIRAMKLYPDRMMGQVTLNPQYLKESLEEIKRCVDQGMVGIKVYYQVKINDPLFFPIIEKSMVESVIIFPCLLPLYVAPLMTASIAMPFSIIL